MEDKNTPKPNYKIYFFKGVSKWEKEVVEKFYAEDDDAAYAYLEEVKKSGKYAGKELYYKTITFASTIDGKGNRSPEVDAEDFRAMVHWIHENTPWHKKAWEEVKDFFAYWLVDRPKDLYYWTRDLVYLLKNKEAYSNQWNLDWHILDSIERNVPSLIKHSHSLAFIDDAILQVHGHEPGFDLDKFHEDHCAGYPQDIEDLAIEIQYEEYKKLLLYVKLYKYYANFGDVDFNNPDEVAFDKEWRHTLPLKKGTYDEVSDYKALFALSQEYWDKIWDWMKKHGHTLND